MSLSIQTNVASLTAQQNLRVNSNFQNQTIQRLTSGYRINSAADDAAGLAVANQFRNSIAELTQGVSNANDGMAQLQIADGGLSNISNILDRLKTLATESASNTFTGNRATLNNEYQSLLSEVTRQASNIGLVQNGSMNKQLQVYIGGGSSQANAQVSVDLSGAPNTVDANGLGIGTTNVLAGGIALNGNAITDLNNPGLMINTTTGGTGATQVFTFNYVNSSGQAATFAASVTSSNSAGVSVQNALSQLNSQLGTIGLSAAVNTDGALVIGGGSPFSLQSAVTTLNGGGALVPANQLSTDIAAGAQTNVNLGAYNVSTTVTSMAGELANETLAFSNGTITKYVTLDTSATDGASTANEINAQVGSMGIYALKTNGTTGLTIQSSANFTITMVGQSTLGKGIWGGTAVGNQIATPVSAPTQTAAATGNALAALSSINNAVAQLGQVQGRVGAGENQLNYAISLAQSQITNFSSAQSQIRDADVAAEAANLTKAQVLQQSSIAAMAQANSAPQAILALLKG
jgi:flagellin